jgi:hypothetical protein
MSFPNRLAAQGEELVVHRFSSGSLGLASPADLQKLSSPLLAPKRPFWVALRDFFLLEPEPPVPAVCIPPSSRLMLRDIPERLQAEYGIHPEEEVIFHQISAEVNTYRDAVRFQNGRVIRLQELCEGQRVTVLDVGDPRPVEGDFAARPAAVETPALRGW